MGHGDCHAAPSHGQRSSLSFGMSIIGVILTPLIAFLRYNDPLYVVQFLLYGFYSVLAERIQFPDIYYLPIDRPQAGRLWPDVVSN